MRPTAEQQSRDLAAARAAHEPGAPETADTVGRAVAGEAAAFAARAAANRVGILWMLYASSAFIVNDTIVKIVLARVPMAQMVVVRGVMAIALITFVAWRMGALVRIDKIFRGWVGVRAGCEGVATFLYLAALFHLPLANATAIHMSSPVFIAVLARVFLGERVDRRRWTAIALGFLGVLLVIQPSADGFNVYAWLCLAATLIYAGRDLLTRRIPVGIPSIVVTLATAAVVVGMAAVGLVYQGWTPMRWGDVGLLALASVCLASAYHAVIASVRGAEVSVVAPFRYTGLLWALLLGYLFWGDVPNGVAVAGICLLIGAGLYMIHQQRVPKR
jgi:drug/metabolite transporter (DMT)-like permease